MPITNSETIKHTLEEVAIHYGGSVSVVIKTEVTGLPHTLRTFEISQAEALPFWGSLPTPDMTRWADLCNLLYTILINRGDLSGTIS